MADGREEAGVQVAVGGEPRAGAVAAERLGDAADDADLAGSVPVPIALRHLAAISRVHRFKRPPPTMVATISAAGATSARRQPFVWPTSMYSMKRTVVSRPRK